MPVAMPKPDRLPAGPLRDLVSALHELYAAAGRPGARQLSTAIRDRDDLRDTVSHETISAMLRGDALPRWIKVECLVRQLAHWAVTHPDPDEEVRRFHHLWLLASDSSADARPAPPRQLRRDFLPPPAADPHAPAADGRHPVAATVVASVPGRNPHFTGRQPLLDAIRSALTRRTVPPLVVHGLGGVGKSQLAAEYAHRWSDRYDLMWWIPAEQPTQIPAALAALGQRLDLPASRDMQQTAATVLEALETTALRWLLVYDNADRPEDVRPLMPATGGHAIVTTRNIAWAGADDDVEVPVFARTESVDLVCRRGRDISPGEADRLADRLGDLPLALAQVAAMQAATRMPVPEYLRLFGEHLDELLSAVPAGGYPRTVATLVALALDRLQTEAPAAAQLLAMFAFLSPEPVPVALLRSGRDGAVSPPLGRALFQLDSMDRVVGELGRYGLARVDPHGPHIQVHRLVQLVLRETLPGDLAARVRLDVHRLLAAANPGDPDDPRTWALHAEIGSHVVPAGLARSTLESARRVVLDQIRYLYSVGDYESSRRLAASAVSDWSAPPDDGGLGPEHELTVLAIRHHANALRALGNYEESQRMTAEALERLRTSSRYGPGHPRTIDMAGVVGQYLRVTGSYQEALAVDEEAAAAARRSYGPEHPNTLRILGNVAVSRRLIGDVAAAFAIDQELEQALTTRFGNDDPRTLRATGNLILDLYDLGRYRDALSMLNGVLPRYRERLGQKHMDVLVVGRMEALALRKTGQVTAAVEQARDNYHDCHVILGPDHEHTLAAVMTYANALTAAGDPVGARSLAAEAITRYRRRFGERNPLTLAAATNLGSILRALGDRREAHQIDQITLGELRQKLGATHPYTLASAVGLATDLAQSHDPGAARALSERTYAGFRQARGATHPDTLTCAVNLAHDLGGTDRQRKLLDRSIAGLATALGPDHPAVTAAQAGHRLECDIEPPPT